jgi:hypothetical protein
MIGELGSTLAQRQRDGWRSSKNYCQIHVGVKVVYSPNRGLTSSLFPPIKGFSGLDGAKGDAGPAGPKVRY